MKNSKFKRAKLTHLIRFYTASSTQKAFALVFILASSIACSQSINSLSFEAPPVKVAAEKMDDYLPFLEGKEVGLVANHTALVGKTHLVDTLLSTGVNITKVFVPEHGFRGTADAGEHVKNARDAKTKLPLVSLYGRAKKPKPSDLIGVEIMVFDIQDVGVRFYTYISTLFYVMQACAEFNIPLVVLDRPNPNGFYVDGPMLDEDFSSFVGIAPLPLVHGMTVGELALLFNEEAWIGEGLKCELSVVSCNNYNHSLRYALPVNPSPNLKNMQAIYLYPSLGLFEGTVVSVGRGTDDPFLKIGHPDFTKGDLEFTPTPREGAKFPKLENQLCKGLDLSQAKVEDELNLKWLLLFYNNLNLEEEFFISNNFFNLLAGTDKLKNQILAGKTEAEIRASWAEDLEAFKALRKKYLLYPDFE